MRWYRAYLILPLFCCGCVIMKDHPLVANRDHVIIPAQTPYNITSHPSEEGPPTKIITNIAETPDIYLKNWIKTPENKKFLESWLKNKSGITQDVNVFLTSNQYKDMYYEAYADLIGTK